MWSQSAYIVEIMRKTYHHSYPPPSLICELIDDHFAKTLASTTRVFSCSAKCSERERVNWNAISSKVFPTLLSRYTPIRHKRACIFNYRGEERIVANRESISSPFLYYRENPKEQRLPVVSYCRSYSSRYAVVALCMGEPFFYTRTRTPFSEGSPIRRLNRKRQS